MEYKITTGLANMLTRMYECWKDNERPFFCTDEEYLELEAFCTQEPSEYRLADNGLQLTLKITTEVTDERN